MSSTTRSRRPTQLSDSDLSSLEEGTSSNGSDSERRLMHSEGKKKGKVRRGLHKVHKRAKAGVKKIRDAKGKGREVEVTRTQRMVCWGIFAIVAIGLAVWMWKTETYKTVEDFVTFPSLTTPVDVMSVVGEVTAGAASVANVVADGFKNTFHIGRRELLLPDGWPLPAALPAPPGPFATAEVWAAR
ncbi:hypothetical protein BCR35DRAFT_43771 [Leucosporidium creatinivorum]|uniref:Uncharacterized protein n=1 Tax=Leucosporidium creatinivorum TaxID=106004 RepID=A0A1Y2FTY0_9BASI|nr:hypothetical protein BCR35DRAFT_43771 [Leucosporidium creatinivorum]